MSGEWNNHTNAGRMGDLRSFISSRKREVLREKSTLLRELRDIARVKAALGTRRGPRAEKSTTDKMIAVLQDATGGGTRDEILQWVGEKFGTSVNPKSASELLSRAKADGLVRLDLPTKRWFANADSRSRNPEHSPL